MCHVSGVTCHVSCVTCYMSCVTCNFFLTKWWSLLVAGLLSTGLTPSSFWPKEKRKESYKQTASILVCIKFHSHWLNCHHNSDFYCPSPMGISFSTYPSWDMRALKKALSSIFFGCSGVWKKTDCLLCTETRDITLTSLNSQLHKVTEQHKGAKISVH